MAAQIRCPRAAMGQCDSSWQTMKLCTREECEECALPICTLPYLVPVGFRGPRVRIPWTKIAEFIKLMVEGSYRPSAPFTFLSLDGPGTDPDPHYFKSRGKQGALWVLTLYLENITEFLSEREDQQAMTVCWGWWVESKWDSTLGYPGEGPETP